MLLEEIKKAVNNGKRVYWVHDGYEVVKDALGQWFILCHMNNHCVGLTWRDGTTMNGEPEDFFIGE